MTPRDHRLNILERVKDFVCRDRQTTYGDAEDNFKNIADRWSIYIRTRFPDYPIQFKSIDVAAMMMDVKLSRIAASPKHQDSWDDAAGYAVCGAAINEKENDIPKQSQMEMLNPYPPSGIRMK